MQNSGFGSLEARDTRLSMGIYFILVLLKRKLKDLPCTVAHSFKVEDLFNQDGFKRFQFLDKNIIFSIKKHNLFCDSKKD